MARYVNLDDVFETLLHNWGYYGLEEDLNNLPAADVAQVKHSEWILHNDGSGTCKRCNTKQKLIWDWDGWQHYCGHCGAKMDGGQTE